MTASLQSFQINLAQETPEQNEANLQKILEREPKKPQATLALQ